MSNAIYGFTENAKRAVKNIKANSKYFFDYAKSKSKVKVDVGPLIDQDGNLTSDPLSMSEILRRQFESVFSTP